MKKMKRSFEWNKITPLSKYLAMALFIALPFIGFILGIKYQRTINITNESSTATNLLTPKPTTSPVPELKTYYR